MPKRQTGKQLNVTILQAKDLLEGKEPRNIVVKLEVDDQEGASKMVTNSLNPVFNEDFAVVLTTKDPDLYLYVVDKHEPENPEGKETVLGYYKVALGFYENNPAKQRWFKLEKKDFRSVDPQGEIEIKVEYGGKVPLDDDEPQGFKKTAHVAKKKGGLMESMFKDLNETKKVKLNQERELEKLKPEVKQLTKKVKDREAIIDGKGSGDVLQNLQNLEEKVAKFQQAYKEKTEALEIAEMSLTKKEKQIMQLEKQAERQTVLARQNSIRASKFEADLQSSNAKAGALADAMSLTELAKKQAEDQLSVAFAAMGPVGGTDDDDDDAESESDEEGESGLVEEGDEGEVLTGDAAEYKKAADAAEKKMEKEKAAKLEWKEKCHELEQMYNEMLLTKQESKESEDTAAKLEMMEQLREENEELKITVKLTESQLEDAMKKYRKEAKERKKLYNEIQELKGNIRVYCRCRPISKAETDRGTHDVTSFGELDDVTIFNDDGTKKRFEFDSCFDPGTSQEKVFEDTKPLMQSVMDGFNVCMFAYGQTGSGKTYTMQGPIENPGVNLRAMMELFRLVEEKGGDYEFEMGMSVLEIYCESIKDLLGEGSDLKVRQEKRGKRTFNIVESLTHTSVRSVDDVLAVIAEANKNRRVVATAMNAESSRSHLVMSVDVATIDKLSGKKTQSALHMIDLAGSERVGRSEVQGQALKEAQAINQSLSSLGNVLAALGRGDNHVPYRNSKLTHVLADALGGNSKVLMFCNISPASDNLGETLGSLQFATRARQVELGKATANVGDSQPAELDDDEPEPAKEEKKPAARGGRATSAAKPSTPAKPAGRAGRTTPAKPAGRTPAAKTTPRTAAAGRTARPTGGRLGRK